MKCFSICNKTICFIFLIIVQICGIRCRKFVEVKPPKTEIVTATVFSDDATAKSAVDAIYSEMAGSSAFASGGSASISVIAGLSADEFTNYASGIDQLNVAANTLDPFNSLTGTPIWQTAYQYIYYANSVLEGLAASTGVSTNQKKELEGEAKFIRAFCHFCLLNLFGDVPLVVSTDYRVNAIAARTPVATVYQQVIKDLTDAGTLLAPDYSFSAGERIRPNKWAAIAMLARVYAYNKDWPHSEQNATLIIDNPDYSLLSNLDDVFKKNSPEAIWQLMPVVPDYNTNEGNVFILTSTPSNVALSPQLLNAFEANDKRRTSWVGSFNDGTTTFYFPFKYKIKGSGQALEEYSMVIRLAELYLLRAEARASQNNVGGSQSDLNKIRTRAGLPGTTASTQSMLLDAIFHERQIELFSEWGHRWLDLKRSQRADAVLGTIKAPNWQLTDIFYPIPQSEIKINPHLAQNPGY